MIILILLGLFQALILPGLLCTYTLKNIDFRDRLILSSTLSLLINYFIVWLLYAFKSYSQTSVLVLIGLEVILAVQIRSLILQDVKNTYKYCSETLRVILNTKTINLYTLLFSLFCIYYFYLLKTNGFLTVFTHWDAVVSWNRWAIELHEGTFNGSRGYPLAIPALFSLVYTFANETNIQTLVKYICIYWPFLGGFAIFRCGTYLPKLKNSFGIAAIFYLYMLSKGSWTIDFIFSGLVDPIMAAYGAIFVYSCLLISSNKIKLHHQYIRIITLTTLSISGSALIKMTGAILTFDFILVMFFIIFSEKFWVNNKKYFLILITLSIAIALHWYALTTFYWRDWQVLSEYSSLQDSRIWIRPYLHLELFGATFGWIFTILVMLGAFSSRNILLFFVLFVIPLFLFCGLTVGYDLRATFILFAPLSIIAAFGMLFIYKILNSIKVKIYSLHLSNLNKSIYIPIILSIIVLAACSFILTTIMSHDKIIGSNTEKRIAANDFASDGNRRLLRIFESEPNARIISCWQTPIGLPGAKGKFIATGNCTVTMMQGWLSDPNTKYWLYRDEGNPNQPLTPDFVANALRNQPIHIHAEPLGSGFVLYSKN
jgi:hypothetical protein